jgi:hypothetical protein
MGYSSANIVELIAIATCKIGPSIDKSWNVSMVSDPIPLPGICSQQVLKITDETSLRVATEIPSDYVVIVRNSVWKLFALGVEKKTGRLNRRTADNN